MNRHGLSRTGIPSALALPGGPCLVNRHSRMERLPVSDKTMTAPGVGVHRHAHCRPGLGGKMAKYDPLSRYLDSKSNSSLTLTFPEIEAIIGARLPPSARAQKEWWWSDPVPESPQVQCRAWVHSGYFTAVISLDTEQVTFRKGRPVPKHRHSTLRGRIQTS